jgi:hypothetical protein
MERRRAKPALVALLGKITSTTVYPQPPIAFPFLFVEVAESSLLSKSF